MIKYGRYGRTYLNQRFNEFFLSVLCICCRPLYKRYADTRYRSYKPYPKDGRGAPESVLLVAAAILCPILQLRQLQQIALDLLQTITEDLQLLIADPLKGYHIQPIKNIP